MITVHINGGVVQGVTTDDNSEVGIEVMVIDYDEEDDGSNAKVTFDKDEPCRAWAYNFGLSGTYDTKVEFDKE